jgi:hypothetical protein
MERFAPARETCLCSVRPTRRVSGTHPSLMRHDAGARGAGKPGASTGYAFDTRKAARVTQDKARHTGRRPASGSGLRVAQVSAGAHARAARTQAPGRRQKQTHRELLQGRNGCAHRAVRSSRPGHARSAVALRAACWTLPSTRAPAPEQPVAGGRADDPQPKAPAARRPVAQVKPQAGQPMLMSALLPRCKRCSRPRACYWKCY